MATLRRKSSKPKRRTRRKSCKRGLKKGSNSCKRKPGPKKGTKNRPKRRKSRKSRKSRNSCKSRNICKPKRRSCKPKRRSCKPKTDLCGSKPIPKLSNPYEGFSQRNKDCYDPCNPKKSTLSFQMEDLIPELKGKKEDPNNLGKYGHNALCADNSDSFENLDMTDRIGAVKALAQNPCDSYLNRKTKTYVSIEALPTPLLREILNMYNEANLGVSCKSNSSRGNILSVIKGCFKVNTECNSGVMCNLDETTMKNVKKNLVDNFADKISETKTYGTLVERINNHSTSVLGIRDAFKMVETDSNSKLSNDVIKKSKDDLHKHLKHIQCNSHGANEAKRILVKVCEVLHFDCSSADSSSVDSLIRRIKNDLKKILDK